MVKHRVRLFLQEFLWKVYIPFDLEWKKIKVQDVCHSVALNNKKIEKQCIMLGVANIY